MRWMYEVFFAAAVVTFCVFSHAADTASGTVGGGGGDDPARLLVFKEVLNKYFVENMDIIIKYSIFNVGGVSATNVELKDATFGPDFKIMGGQTEVSFNRILPSSNVSSTLVVRPLKYGQYNFSSAIVTYRSGEDPEVIQGFSSEPGEGYIVPFREFDKRFSPHLMDWAAFAIMSVPPLVIPFMLWHSSKSKYEAVLANKKAK
jgi:translocon-associated protein subunit beta